RISAKYFVEIGRNCTIAPEAMIMDSDYHDMHDHSKEGASEAVIIEDNVWIATRATVLKGVRIGRNAVVAAGAVVTKDVPPYTVVGGNPAKVIKHLN
ncbi:MAG TPA: acyltransferase, partial [Chitinophagales bacterium]|nr:acyltransferase [Chitinophagales bacterium]